MDLLRVSPRMLKLVVNYLHGELGLSVIGPSRDLDACVEDNACMGYSAEDVIKWRKHLMRGTEFIKVKY